MQHKYVEEFQKNAMIEFQKLREELENEMEDRFVSQDEIIDNLSNSIKTFQDTMQIIGQTVI
jgi:regulator of sigma D|tara:strand:+ start:545 stop:730 length:186 start_codon:yes stop_codon:yes gene_type:complete